MTEFKFYHLNSSGVVDGCERLRLADVAAAIEHARAVAGRQRIEVWTGDRRVAVVPPRRLSVPTS